MDPLLAQLRETVVRAIDLADGANLPEVAARLSAALASLDGDAGPWTIDDVEAAIAAADAAKQPR